MKSESPDLLAQRVFLLLARLDLSDAELADIRRCATGIDWHQVLDLARRSGIGGMVSRSVDRVGPHLLPRDVVRVLAAQRVVAEVRNLKFFEEVSALCTTASNLGLTLVPLKGIGLLNGRPYSDLSLRMSSDMDLVTRRSEFNDLEKILAEHGYQASLRRDFEIRHEHHVQFQKPHKAGVLTVELHWTPFYSLYSQPELDVAALDRTVRFLGQENEIEFLDLEDTIISLLLHLAMHRFRGQLKWLVDIAEIFRKFETEIDWQMIAERSLTLGAFRVVSFGIWLTHDLMQAPVPADFFCNRGVRWRLLRRLNPVDGLITGGVQPALLKRSMIDLMLRDRLSDSMRHVVFKVVENQERRRGNRFPAWLSRKGLNSNL